MNANSVSKRMEMLISRVQASTAIQLSALHDVRDELNFILTAPNVLSDERTTINEQEVRARVCNAREAGSLSQPKVSVVMGEELQGRERMAGWSDIGPPEDAYLSYLCAIDGSVRSRGSRTVGGCSAVWAANSPLNSSLAIPYPLSSTQMELLGLRLMLTSGIRAGARSLIVITDSMVTIKAVEMVRHGWDIDLSMSAMESAGIKGISMISLEVRELMKEYQRVVLLHQYAHQGTLDSAGVLNNLADLKAISCAEVLLDDLRRSAPGLARERQIRSMIMGYNNQAEAAPQEGEGEDQGGDEGAEEAQSSG